MKYIIIIEFDAKPKAAERLRDAIDAAVMKATQAGGIETVHRATGRDAEGHVALHRPRGRVRGGGDDTG